MLMVLVWENWCGLSWNLYRKCCLGVVWSVRCCLDE